MFRFDRDEWLKKNGVHVMAFQIERGIVIY